MTIISSAGNPAGPGYGDMNINTFVNLTSPATVDFYCNTISARFMAWGGSNIFSVAVGTVVGDVYSPRKRVNIAAPTGPSYPTTLVFRSPVSYTTSLFTGFEVLAGEYVAYYMNNQIFLYNDNTSPSRVHGRAVGDHLSDVSFAFTRYTYPPNTIAAIIQVLLSSEDGIGRAGCISEMQPVFEPAGNNFELEVVDSVPIACSSIMECEGSCRPVRENPVLIRQKP